MVRIAYAAALIAAAALVAIVTPADAQPRRVQVGTLACSLSSSIGLVVGSQRNVNCDFTASGAPVEHYTGTMTRIGLDIGVTTGGAIIWAVFADTDRYAAGMLSGTYARRFGRGLDRRRPRRQCPGRRIEQYRGAAAGLSAGPGRPQHRRRHRRLGTAYLAVSRWALLVRFGGSRTAAQATRRCRAS